jgi:hypothetical protein
MSTRGMCCVAALVLCLHEACVVLPRIGVHCAQVASSTSYFLSMVQFMYLTDRSGGAICMFYRYLPDTPITDRFG